LRIKVPLRSNVIFGAGWWVLLQMFCLCFLSHVDCVPFSVVNKNLRGNERECWKKTVAATFDRGYLRWLDSERLVCGWGCHRDTAIRDYQEYYPKRKAVHR
jgi:hypothetical protein